MRARWAGTGRDSPRTRRLVADYGGFEYDSDYYGDDLPFWMQVRRATAGRAAADRALHAGLQRHALRAAAGYSHAEPFFQYLKTASTRSTPKATRPKMLSIGMRCRLLGRPGRIVALQRFLDYIAARDRVWICRRLDIARHWRAIHPFPSTR